MLRLINCIEGECRLTAQRSPVGNNKQPMEYAKLVDVYKKLESTTKKLAKRDIIVNFLKEAPAKLLPTIVLLLEGRVFPAWDETELGVADNIMFKAISKTAGISEDSVKSESKKQGDIGSAVESILKKKRQATLFSKQLTVENVYENLAEIPKLTGAGSIEQKVLLISELLSCTSPLEGKYLARTVLENLRIGVGEGILRDAISLAFNIPVEIVENAYNIRNDFGEVAEIAKEDPEKLKKVELKLGRPLKPMLAQKVETIEDALEDMNGKAAFEFKYDGLRIQVHKLGNKITLFSRRLDNVTKQFPEIVSAAQKCINAENALVEGEAVGVNPKTGKAAPFQQLSKRIKRKYDIAEMQKELPVVLNLFDIMYLNGKTFLNVPFEERRKAIEKIIKVENNFKLAEQLITGNAKEAEFFYKEAISLGHEGLMIKNLSSPYTPGARVNHMYKLKPEQETLDLVIIGALWGEGRRSKWLGSFVLGALDPETGTFVEVGKVATGLTDSDLENLTALLKPLIISEHIKEVFLKPKVVVEVGYEEIQKSPTYKSGYALRFPRVKKIREDKGAEDTDTLEKVGQLYDVQKGK